MRICISIYYKQMYCEGCHYSDFSVVMKSMIDFDSFHVTSIMLEINFFILFFSSACCADCYFNTRANIFSLLTIPSTCFALMHFVILFIPPSLFLGTSFFLFFYRHPIVFIKSSNYM